MRTEIIPITVQNKAAVQNKALPPVNFNFREEKRAIIKFGFSHAIRSNRDSQYCFLRSKL
jgi:hypothetical protein